MEMQFSNVYTRMIVSSQQKKKKKYILLISVGV